MSHHHHPRQILTSGVSRKRKEREDFYSTKQTINPQVSPTTSSKASDSDSSNRLLAGYLAHEFLTKGTLFGREFDPARSEAVPVTHNDPVRQNKPGSGQISEAESSRKIKQSYADVASLVKNDGTHVSGIVNPTQLARWIQM